MRKYILIYLHLFLIISCNQNRKEELTVQDIEIFKNTPAWDLAQAVDKQDISEMKSILKKDESLINYQEAVFGTTLLMRSISSEKYNATKELLENGANPNIISKIGTTALFKAISFSWEDTKANDDPKFVKLLLDFKANPNITYCSPTIEGQTDPIECGTSPLMYSISRGIDKTKLLIDAGADIDYKTKLGVTAAIEALLLKDVNASYSLVVDKKAKITEPYYFYSLTNDATIEKGKPHYPVDLLLDWDFEIGSEAYIKKMLIVQEFQRQGVNYSERKKNIKPPIEKLGRPRESFPSS